MRFTVIVTGAGRGIGRCIALGLLDAGMNVAVMDRDPDLVRAVHAEAERANHGERVLPFAGDIISEDAAHGVVAAARTRFGSIDGLVNNAGIGRAWIRANFTRDPIRFWELAPDHWRRFLDVNATGFFTMTCAVLPVLFEQDWGRIVTVTTSLDTMINPGSIGYGSAKAAVEASMAILAGDLGGRGVTANVLVPGGPVDTPAFPDDGFIPRSAFIQPEVMLPPLRWLLSHDSDGTSGRRFIARQWNPSLPVREAAEIAGAPIAWPQLGGQPLLPPGIDRP